MDAVIDARNKKFWLILATCWLIYASAYFCRVNYSVAIPYIQGAFGWDKATIGMVAGAFFAAYALGQLINGMIGDRFNPRIFVAVGLVVAGVANALLSLADTLPAVMALWGINGYFQSMLWGPIVRTLGVYTPREKYSLITVVIPTSMVAGYLVSYALISRLALLLKWQYVFLMPGIFLVLCAVFWFAVMKDFSRDRELSIKSGGMGLQNGNAARIHPLQSVSMPVFIWRSKLYSIALICVMQGILKEGLTLWGPVFISESQGVGFQTALNVITFVPLMNFGGILLLGAVNKLLGYREKRAMVYFTAICALFAAGLYISAGSRLALTVAFYGGMSATIFGVSSTLTTAIPMHFAGIGKASTAAGFVDSAVYLGAALAGPLMGSAADRMNWNGVALIWMAVAVLSAVLTLISVDYKNGIPE